MGAIIARFRKKKTTFEILDQLDGEIKSIEKFRFNTQQSEKKIVTKYLLISVLVYLLAATLYYYYFFEKAFKEQIYYIAPLLFAPIGIWFGKRLLKWYYSRKLLKNETKLSVLRSERKKLLDKVMDTETYKVAKTILEKFAPDQLHKSPGPYDGISFKSMSASSSTISTPTSASLRNRNLQRPRSPILSSFGRTPSLSGPPHMMASTPSLITNGQNTMQSLSMIKHQSNMSLTPLPLPRAILPRDRTVLDKMVEYLVGDGPSNRFALICKNCQSHNGMALREEFEYVAFRCCYCYNFNPSRKLRPSAPILEQDSSPIRMRLSDKSSSDSEKLSDTESEPGSDKERKSSRGSSKRNSDAETTLMDNDHPIDPTITLKDN